MARAIGWLGALLLLASIRAPTAAASLAEAMDLPALVRSADTIVLGRAASRHARWQGRHIVTDVTLHVERSLAGGGSPGSEMVVTHLGGEVGEVGMKVAGMPRLPPGERALVFARRPSSGRGLRPVGMSQGVMPIRRQDGRDMVLPGAGGLALVRRGPGGALQPAPGALLHPRPLAEVVSDIGELLRKEHGR